MFARVALLSRVAHDAVLERHIEFITHGPLGKDAIKNVVKSNMTLVVQKLVHAGVEIDADDAIDNVNLLQLLPNPPSQRAINRALGRGDLHVLAYVAERWNLHPDSAHDAFVNGNQRGVFFCMNNGLYPTPETLDCAIQNGYGELTSYVCNVLPTSVGLDIAAEQGNLELVIRLISAGVPLSKYTTDAALLRGQHKVVKYLESRGAMYSEGGVCAAITLMYPNVRDCFRTLCVANTCAARGWLSCVRDLWYLGLLVDMDGMDAACVAGHEDVVSFLLAHGMYPSEHGKLFAPKRILQLL